MSSATGRARSRPRDAPRYTTDHTLKSADHASDPVTCARIHDQSDHRLNAAPTELTRDGAADWNTAQL